MIAETVSNDRQPGSDCPGSDDGRSMKTKESRKKSGKLMGLHTSNMVVMLTDVSDGVCEEVCNPAK